MVLWMAFILAVPPANARQPASSQPYEFTRSYIHALSFCYNISQRWRKQSKIIKNAKSSNKVIEEYLNDLVKDNVDWRVAKNYLEKYLQSPDPMVKKIADSFIVSSERNIALNDDAKRLWITWQALVASKQATHQKERAFVNAQEDLSFKRKEADKIFIEATVLLTKYLLGGDGQSKTLSLTDKQRDGLIRRLDDFAKEYTDWGLKPGQSTVEASVAVLREVLEDSIYTTAGS